MAKTTTLVAIVLLAAALPMVTLANASNRVGAAVEAFGSLERSRTVIAAIAGETVAERTFSGPPPRQPVNVKSLSKTFIAALVGAAVARGVFDGSEQPIVELLGPRVPADAPDGIGRVTVGHLLSMQAGLERTSGENYGAWVSSDDWVANALSRPFVAEPGGPMLYSTGNSHMLSAALTAASGRSTLALARAWLGEPLGITVPAWQQDPQGIYFGGNNMRLSPRALIELGELYRNGGVVDGERILPPDWVETSWQPRGQSQYHDDHYGYGWFVGEMAGEGVYYGWGYGGQLLYVVPSLALTVVLTSDPRPPVDRGGYVERIHAVMAEEVIPAVSGEGDD